MYFLSVLVVMEFEHGSEHARQELYQWVISPALMNFLNIFSLKMTHSVVLFIYKQSNFPTPKFLHESANAF